MTKKRLVLYGGSFDPIHNGHLRLANAVSRLYDAVVLFVPNRMPPWKDPTTKPIERLSMIRLAFRENENTRLNFSNYELESKEERNYTIDTVKYYYQEYKDKADLYLLIGADEANVFDKWKDPNEIARLAKILVVPRPGMEIDPGLKERFKMEIVPFTESGEVSSSAIREGKSMDYPSFVRRYMEGHHLYFFKKIHSKLSQHRYAHVVSVAETAYEIARANNLDCADKIFWAGLLHDLAKELDDETSRKMIEEEYPEYLDMPEWTYHQFLGAKLAKEEFGIEDEEILSAIACHATGKGNMTQTDMILYASDKIEPNRGYDSSGYIASCKANYLEGFKIVLQANMDFYHEQGYKFTDNRLTIEAVKQYLGEESK